MRHPIARLSALALTISIALLLGLGLGCVGVLRHSTSYEYFASPDADDAWTPKIASWQRRERAEEGVVVGAVPPVAGPAEPSPVLAPLSPEDLAAGLRNKYFSFRAERRRTTAREFAEWIQGEAKQHYVADGPIDHWATLEETLRGNGDDCDGLELLVYHALRDLGFSEREVYRAIVYRPSDGQHHMVTLWFEERDDPWVIDPTGAMSRGLRRMSQLADWVPLKVFSDTTEYTVRRSRLATERGALASTP
jgi:hypothetical protein